MTAWFRVKWARYWRYKWGADAMLASSRAEALRELLARAGYKPSERWTK